MKRQLLTKLRHHAERKTVGKRYHLYVPKMGKIRKYPIPGGTVPIQLYHFTLHPECTRAKYRKLKRRFIREERRLPKPHKRIIPGFGSRARAKGKEYGPPLNSL